MIKPIFLMFFTLLVISLQQSFAQNTPLPADRQVRIPSNIDTDVKVIVNPEILISGKIASHTFGSNSDAIEFTLEKQKNSQKGVSTRELKRKKEEIGEYCANDYFKTSGTVSQWKVFDDGGNSDTRNIVPGAIYDLSNFDGTFFKAIENQDRNMIRISLNKANQSAVQDSKVFNPRGIEKVRNKGVNPILNGLKTKVFGSNTMLVSSFEESHSEKQLQITAGGAIPMPSITFDVSSDSKSSEDKSVYYLELEETYFTLTAAGKNVNNQTFFKNANLNTSNYGYVSEVDYGRKILVVLETNTSFSEHTFSSDTEVKVWGDFENTINSFKSNSSLSIDYKIYLFGGTDVNSIPTIGNAVSFDDLLSDLTKLINDGNANAKDGVPIRFTLRDMDGDRIVSTYSPIEEKVKSCNPTYQIILREFKVIREKDGTAESKIEVYGDFKVKAYDDGKDQFYDTQVTELLKTSAGPIVSTIKSNSGRTTIAEKDSPIAKRKGKSKIFQTQYTEGLEGDSFQIPNDAVDNGYFLLNINAFDKDKLSKNDELDGSKKVFFKDLNGYDIHEVTATGDGNEVRFDFIIKRLN